MACSTRESKGICTHPQCPYSKETTHHTECVEINFATNLCEMGEGCLEKCFHSFKKEDVVPCPECQGKYVGDNVCATCGDFGIVRK